MSKKLTAAERTELEWYRAREKHVREAINVRFPSSWHECQMRAVDKWEAENPKP
jgi:hypothetical protein